MPRRHRSDYERHISGETPTRQNNPGANDTAMAPKHNAVSDAVSGGVDWALEQGGFDGDRRTGADENDFYRDNAQYMPGWGDFGLGFLDPGGIASGAWAQDRATNHVGHGEGPNSPWDRVRRGLVERESAMIDQSLASGGDGRLSFGDVYGAHVDAYDQSGGSNGFIDPGSFALAVYAAPMMEHFGIDAGAITGASIDVFNDPTDSASEGWAKRMGLGVAEIGAGAAMMGTGNPLGMVAGAGTMALGAVGLGWNTASAIDHGMLSEWGTAIGEGAAAAGGAIVDGASAVGGAISDGYDAVAGGVGSLLEGDWW